MGGKAAEASKSGPKVVEYPFTPLPANQSYADKNLSPEVRAGAVVKQLTLQEKIKMVAGFDSFYAPGNQRLGLRPLYFSDASQGVHIRKELNIGLAKSIAFPCTLALAATWDPDLATAYAHAIGEECRAGDIAVLLGPGMNIYRSSENGRNFEYMGEDPYLAGVMVAHYVQGVQSAGVMATLKHFACNNDEHRRYNCDCLVGERALHEIYTPAFKSGIDAGAGAVMTSYNLVNGQWAGQSKFVITDLLRGELGFRGMVMSDWGSIKDPAKFLTSGNDLCMPRCSPQNIQAALESGLATEADLDRMIVQWLSACFKMGFYDRPQRDASLLAKYPEHKAIALRTGQESIILLKNDHHLLPLARSGQGKILLVGKAAQQALRGGGSGWVAGYDNVSLLDALRQEYGQRLEFELAPTDEEIKRADYVIVAVGTRDAEDADRPFAITKEWGGDLPARCGSLNSRTVVVGIAGGGFRMTGFKDKVGAIVLALFGGQTQGNSIVDVLTGRTNPSGKLPFTIEKEFADSPGCVNGPVDRGAKGFHSQNPKANACINYREGIFVGYRWYDHEHIQPLFPFGYGLSYTTFKYSRLKLSNDGLAGGGSLTASFTVENTGKVAGAEIAQLYVQAPKGGVERPVKELKGFRRIFLLPGESATVKLNLTQHALAYWDVVAHGWKVEPGKYNCLVGPSSADLPLKVSFNDH
jgi:beta-glucosidase